MTLEKNKATVRRFNDAFNKNELEIFENLLSPELVDVSLQLKQNITEIHKGFPDIYRPIVNIIAEGVGFGCMLMVQVRIQVNIIE